MTNFLYHGKTLLKMFLRRFHASLGSKGTCDVISDSTISDDEAKFQTFCKDGTTSGTVSNSNTSRQKVWKKNLNPSISLWWHHSFIWSSNLIRSEFRPIFIQSLFRSALESKFILPVTSNFEQRLLKWISSFWIKFKFVQSRKFDKLFNQPINSK